MIPLQNEKDVSQAQQERERILQEKLSIGALGQELAMEKIKGMQKDAIIHSLGQQVAQLQLDVNQLKGGDA